MEELNNEIKKKTEELSNKIKKTTEELKVLRKNCNHSEYKVKDTNSDSSMLELRNVCEICGEIIGYPSKEDLKESGYN